MAKISRGDPLNMILPDIDIIFICTLYIFVVRELISRNLREAFSWTFHGVGVISILSAIPLSVVPTTAGISYRALLWIFPTIAFKSLSIAAALTLAVLDLP